MTEPMPDHSRALAQVYDATSINIDAFRNFPIVVDRLRQLNAALRLSPAKGHVLEFGVYKGQSIRALAHAFPQQTFHGFDSFEGLPEAWERAPGDAYDAGHFALDALPPVPDNVTLIKGFFDQTLEPWLAQTPGPVRLIHEDPDLYSSAKYTMAQLTDRIVDGTVIVFDELCDWQDSGVYPNWPEGEWKALCEWLAETGFCFRILSRSVKYQAAIQVYRGTPPPFDANALLAYATAYWQAGCRTTACTVLEQRVVQKPQWATGNFRLANWYNVLKDAPGVMRALDRLAPTLAAKPDHPHAVPVLRLRAIAQHRLGAHDQAFAAIKAFVAANPDNVSGLTFAGRCAAACHDYEAAQTYWQRAYAFSNDKTHNREARASGQQTAIPVDLRAMKFSNLMIHHLITQRQFDTVLDIGSGAGEQARALRAAGKTVTELDYGKSKYFVLNPSQGGSVIGDFMQIKIAETFDCVIASHLLEHQLNVGVFLQKVHAVVREGGIVAISVPPAKPQVVGGHVTNWNAGLLLYNLVLAGFDCRTPWIRRYEHNISVVLEKRTITPEGLHYDTGDIDRIKAYLPAGMGEGFNGDIDFLG